MPSRSRLLVTTSDFVGRGAERELAVLLARLPRDRFDIHVCLWRAVFDYPCPPDLPITVLEKHRPWHVGRTRRRFAALVETWKPDLVFSQLNYVSTVTGSALGLVRDRPAWVVRLAGNPEVEIRWPVLPWTRSVLKGAQVVAGCSRGACGSIQRHLRVPSERIKLLENVVDVDQITAQAREPVSIERRQGVFVFAHAGRLVPQKNQSLILQALERLKDLPVEVWILGTGPLERSLRAEADRRGVADKIRWLGFQRQPQLFMRAADAFLLASNYEGLPNAIIEAMLCGRPVVSTACDFGPSELIEAGVTGELVPPGDATALAQAMRQMIENPERACELGHNAERAARTRFEPERIVEQYVTVFEQAIEEGGR